MASVAVKQAIDELRDATLDSDVEKTDDGSKVTLSRNGKTVAEFVVAGGGGGGQSASTRLSLPHSSPLGVLSSATKPA